MRAVDHLVGLGGRPVRGVDQRPDAIEQRGGESAMGRGVDIVHRRLGGISGRVRHGPSPVLLVGCLFYLGCDRRRWPCPRRPVPRPSHGPGCWGQADREGVMSGRAPSAQPATGEWNPRLAILLAAAMFVLVVDTSLMNVSISAVVLDLGTTVSGVQSAIALEALVSA